MIDLPSALSGLLARSGAGCGTLGQLPRFRLGGRVAGADRTALKLEGFAPWFRIGQRVEIPGQDGSSTSAEIVGFRNGLADAMAIGDNAGVPLGAGCWVAEPPSLNVSSQWLGRLIDPSGRPLDGRGPLPPGPRPYPLRGVPPSAGTRARLGQRLDLGVRALDAFTTCRRGQRLGLFAASGIGKSSLLAMLARQADCDAVVLGLVGERGREVREFVEDVLGPDGMARSVVVCATSDAPAPVRRDSALAAMAVAEALADEGKDVLLLMDSVTRYAFALREIGLAAGEMPVSRGYTPGVFADLPLLLERAGPREDDCGGMITGIFTVLVEGDDHDEPVADAVRGILDGHVVMDRRIAEAGRYPAVDVLRSLSRSVPGCLSADEWALVRRARRILSVAGDMADMVRLGAYRAGMDPAVDEALRLAPRIEAFLSQGLEEGGSTAATFAGLADALEEEALDGR